MLNRLLQEFYKSPNNGRQIVALADGGRLVLTHSEIMGPAILRLSVSRSESPLSLADFDDAGILVGPNSAIADGGPWGLGGSMLRIKNSLHLGWTGPHGIAVAQGEIQDKKIR